MPACTTGLRPVCARGLPQAQWPKVTICAQPSDCHWDCRARQHPFATSLRNAKRRALPSRRAPLPVGSNGSVEIPTDRDTATTRDALVRGPSALVRCLEGPRARRESGRPRSDVGTAVRGPQVAGRRSQVAGRRMRLPASSNSRAHHKASDVVRVTSRCAATSLSARREGRPRTAAAHREGRSPRRGSGRLSVHGVG